MTTLVFWTAVLSAMPIETQWAQVAPEYRPSASFLRTEGETRAVVLLQGLRPHPFSSRNAARAEWDSWQVPGSALVEALGEDADVYAFAYAQTVRVEEIAEDASLVENIGHLKRLGYSDLVLVGYSAGGLVARHFVEDHPAAGVTKVVQVCAPNGGSGWAEARFFVRQSQEDFLNSLTKHGRRLCLARRVGKTIPVPIEFVCVVGDIEVGVNLSGSIQLGQETALALSALAGGEGDGLVSSANQWTEDMQLQGIPAVPLDVNHFRVMRSKAGVKLITELVRQPSPRWNAQQVAEGRRLILGERLDVSAREGLK